MHRFVWSFSACAAQIGSDEYLLSKLVPELEGQFAVCTTETTDEVVFESLDGSFCGLNPIIIGFHELWFGFLGFWVGLERFSCLTVSDVKARLVAFPISSKIPLMVSTIVSSFKSMTATA